MLTNFGKFCRKLRINNGELLYDMAKKLDVSSAFLSKVENGKKKPPHDWKEKVSSIYEIEGDELGELEQCFYEAKNFDSIDISRFNNSDKELMWSFARKLDSVDKDRLRRLLGN